MSEVTALVCRYSTEETPSVEGATIVAFDVEDYATQVNAFLMHLRNKPVLIVDRSYMEPGWMDPMLDELSRTGGIVSPYYRTGIRPIKWFDQVCPSAWMARADVLHNLGGLKQDMLFCQAQIIEWKARRARLTMTAVEAAVCAPSFTPGQTQRVGELYYRQIEDERRMQQIIGGS